MVQANTFGMEPVPGITRKCDSRSLESSAGAIKGVTDEGMPGGREVDADLMGASRFDADFQERFPFTPLQYADEAQCMSAGRACGMERPEARVRNRPRSVS